MYIKAFRSIIESEWTVKENFPSHQRTFLPFSNITELFLEPFFIFEPFFSYFIPSQTLLFNLPPGSIFQSQRSGSAVQLRRTQCIFHDRAR